MNNEELVEKVLDLCSSIDIMWTDDSTQDDVKEKADELRTWIVNNE